jgi:hypothetical protein
LYPIANSCDSVGGQATTCAECLDHSDYTAAISVDSWYYPGVLEECVKRAKQGLMVYIVGSDYHACIRRGKLTGKAADGESHYIISGDSVTSFIHGNPAPYEHRIPVTADVSWSYIVDGGRVIMEIVDTILNGDIPYHIMRMTYVDSMWSAFSIPTTDMREGLHMYAPIVAQQHTYIGPVNKRREVENGMVSFVVDRTIETAKKIADTISKVLPIVGGETVKEENGQVVLTVYSKEKGMVLPTVYRARPSLITPEVGKLIGKTTAAEVVRVSRAATAKVLESGDLDLANEMSDALIIAMHYASVTTGRIVSHMNESPILAKFKEAMRGEIVKFDFTTKREYLWKLVLLFIAFIVPFIPLEVYTTLFVVLTVVPLWIYPCLTSLLLCTWLITRWKSKATSH